MPDLIFNAEVFREQIVQYADAALYPDALLLSYWNFSLNFCSEKINIFAQISSQQLILNLFIAHFIYINHKLNRKDLPVVLASSSAGAESASFTPPPVGNSPFRYWLSTSPYGNQILGILDLLGVGGILIGGSPEKSAFRNASNCLGWGPYGRIY